MRLSQARGECLLCQKPSQPGAQCKCDGFCGSVLCSWAVKPRTPNGRVVAPVGLPPNETSGLVEPESLPSKPLRLQIPPTASESLPGSTHSPPPLGRHTHMPGDPFCSCPLCHMYQTMMRDNSSAWPHGIEHLDTDEGSHTWHPERDLQQQRLTWSSKKQSLESTPYNPPEFPVGTKLVARGTILICKGENGEAPGVWDRQAKLQPRWGFNAKTSAS
jgi:hypothetical protein